MACTANMDNTKRYCASNLLEKISWELQACVWKVKPLLSISLCCIHVCYGYKEFVILLVIIKDQISGGFGLAFQ